MGVVEWRTWGKKLLLNLLNNRIAGNITEWKNRKNHKGFDVASNRCKTEIDNYINQYTAGLNADHVSLFITGHSRGAAVANILGAIYEKTGYKSYTYTYATPNTTTDTNYADYKTIFNFVNNSRLFLTKWKGSYLFFNMKKRLMYIII